MRAIALFLKLLPVLIHSTGDWIALKLPVHAVLAWRLRNPDSDRVR